MSITDGLTTGDSPDVNSQGGFEAAMAALGAPPVDGAEEAPARDTAISGGLVEAPATATPRDPETGQFVPAAPDTPVVEPEADTATEGEDPAVAAFLAKYNGDTQAAIKAAAEAQSVIGRQGQELGQTRVEMARLQGQMDALLALQTAAPTVTLTQEQAEERAIEVGVSQGFFQGATTLVNEALISGDYKAYDSLLRNWALEDPIDASRFDGDFQAWRRAEAAKADAPGPDPVLATIKDQQEVNDIAVTLGQLAQERGDGWALIAPHMDAAIEQVHPTVAALVASPNAEDRLAGARIVADRAQAIAAATVAPVQTAAQIAAEAATARKIAGSQMASSTLRPVAAPAAGSEGEKEEAIAKFKAGFFENDRSIASGLTYGNKP